MTCAGQQDITRLDDPDLLAERRRVRDELEAFAAECGSERRFPGTRMTADGHGAAVFRDRCAVQHQRAALVQLAVDGLVLGELLQLSPYTAEERSRLVKALLKAADRCGRMQ